mgnify:CR=1 FL=1
MPFLAGYAKEVTSSCPSVRDSQVTCWPEPNSFYNQLMNFRKPFRLIACLFTAGQVLGAEPSFHVRPDAEAVLNRISEVRATIDPTTAD